MTTGPTTQSPDLSVGLSVGGAPAGVRPFSAELRAATRHEHTDAERAPFAHALVRGNVPRAGFEDLLLQLVQVYAVLEEVGEGLRDDPVTGSFIDDALLRRPALEADLDALIGAGWRERVAPLPATTAYTDRIAATAGDPPRFVGHHYTRYLGDLSGGQIIGRVASRVYGLDAGSGAFFRFDAIDDVDAFKAGYRARLDAAPWDADQQAAVIEESRVAFGLNAGLFGDLGRIHVD